MEDEEHVAKWTNQAASFAARNFLNGSTLVISRTMAQEPIDDRSPRATGFVSPSYGLAHQMAEVSRKDMLNPRFLKKGISPASIV